MLLVLVVGRTILTKKKVNNQRKCSSSVLVLEIIQDNVRKEKRKRGE